MKRCVYAFLLLVLLVMCSACNAPFSSSPTPTPTPKPQYPQLAQSYNGSITATVSIPTFFILNNISENPDGSFLGFVLWNVPLNEVQYTATGGVQPFVHGQASFSMFVFSTQIPTTHFTGSFDQQTGVISGMVLDTDTNETMTWTLTPFASRSAGGSVVP